MSHYLAGKTALPFEAALARVRETLAAEGFGESMRTVESIALAGVAATVRDKLQRAISAVR